MRSIIACGIILLGLNGTAHEPAYFTNGRAASPLVEIDSAAGRSDRLTVATLAPRALTLQIFRPTAADLQLRLASANADLDADLLTNPSAGANDIRGTAVSLDDLCQALFTSAQANDIPVQFFANLIWQESGFDAKVVSRAGAQASPSSCIGPGSSPHHSGGSTAESQRSPGSPSGNSAAIETKSCGARFGSRCTNNSIAASASEVEA